MPKGTNQKFKLYRLAQLMLEQTDDEHYITMPEILAGLGNYGITADRKSIYQDLKDLEVLGIEVEGEPDGKGYHYHVVSRPFELPELKLLVDAIQSSRFITEKKTNALIRKLEKLVSRYEANRLQRQVFVSGRIKTMNESIYYAVDTIHNAISDNKKIRFQYYQWNVKRKWCCAGEAHFMRSVPGAFPGTARIIIWWVLIRRPGRSGITGWIKCSASR